LHKETGKQTADESDRVQSNTEVFNLDCCWPQEQFPSVQPQQQRGSWSESGVYPL